jgi:Uma2 family endonuclease
MRLPSHKKLQRRIERQLEALAGNRGVVTTEFPSPPLIVEVLSPSNSTAKIDRQRIVAMSAGTQEFWIVDPERHTVQVTNLHGTKTYTSADAIELSIFGGSALCIESLNLDKN